MIATYICSQKHNTITECNVINAILPNFIDCATCREIATLTSVLDQRETENAVPTHEWYVPVKKQRGISKEDNRRYKKHGIYLRLITGAEHEEAKDLGEYTLELTKDLRTSAAKFKKGDMFKQIQDQPAVFERTDGKKINTDKKHFK